MYNRTLEWAYNSTVKATERAVQWPLFPVSNCRICRRSN